MQLSPRYDGEPIIAIEGALDDQREPFLRQRRRLADALAALTDEQWRQPSRCAGWSAQDVIAHLIGTNHFWAASITAGLAGEPTRILAAFDPVATPALMVESMRTLTPCETLEQLVDSHRGFLSAVESLDDEGWSTLAESPPGHVPIRLLVSHALWDCWVHERDVLIPLGIEPDGGARRGLGVPALRRRARAHVRRGRPDRARRARLSSRSSTSTRASSSRSTRW